MIEGGRLQVICSLWVNSSFLKDGEFSQSYVGDQERKDLGSVKLLEFYVQVHSGHR